MAVTTFVLGRKQHFRSTTFAFTLSTSYTPHTMKSFPELTPAGKQKRASRTARLRYKLFVRGERISIHATAGAAVAHKLLYSNSENHGCPRCTRIELSIDRVPWWQTPTPPT